jgi:hypothetical protein
MFKPGNTGRPKGSPNKTTKLVRELVIQVVNIGLKDIENDMQQLTAYERLTIVTKLMPYVLQRATVDADDQQITIRLIDESTSTYDTDTYPGANKNTT